MPRTLLVSKKSTNIVLNNPSDPCKDNVRFFTTLATKLKDMAISINNRINEAKNKSIQQIPNSIVFAAVDVPKMTIGVKLEYIEYITRYGPPVNGTFDPDKLEQLRIELGITNNAYTI